MILFLNLHLKMLLKIQVSELMFRKQDERMKTGQKVEKMTETNNFNDLELELSNSTSTTTRQLIFFVSDERKIPSEVSISF